MRLEGEPPKKASRERMKYYANKREAKARAIKANKEVQP